MMMAVMEWWRRGMSLVLAASLLAGCTSFGDDDEELGPAPLTDIEAEYRLDEVWSHNIGDGQGDLYNRLTPAITGSHIYVAAASGDVAAFDRENGKRLWSVDLDLPIHGGVGTGGGLILVASNNGRILALDATNGELRWDTAVGSEVLAPPQGDSGIVVAQTFDGRVVGLDTKDGSRRWSYSAGAPVLMLRASSTPLLYEGAVIAGFANGKVVALDLQTGKPYWETRVATPTGSSEIERLVDVSGNMLVEDGVLYVAAYQAELTAIEVRSGRRLWARPASSYVGLAHGFSNVYVATADGSVLAMADNNQGSRWEQSALARRQLSGTAVWGNTVVVGDVEGYIHLLSQADGRLVGRERVDRAGIRVAPLAAGDMLYVFGNSGDLVAYRLE